MPSNEYLRYMHGTSSVYEPHGMEDEVIDAVSAEEIVDDAVVDMTDLQAGISVLFEWGWTLTEVAEHFEVRHQTIQAHMKGIRRKLVRHGGGEW